MNDIRRVAGTKTREYAKFINTPLGRRNLTADMRACNSAAINALGNGIDYTLSIDGERALQELGDDGSAPGKHNRFFTAYPPRKNNQIINFENNIVSAIQNPFTK